LNELNQLDSYRAADAERWARCATAVGQPPRSLRASGQCRSRAAACHEVWSLCWSLPRPMLVIARRSYLNW